MGSSVVFHYRTKQISAATPLWGAPNPNEPFMIERDDILVKDDDILKDGVVVGWNCHSIPNPLYNSPINLPKDKMGFIYKGENWLCCCGASGAEAKDNIGAGLYYSLATMATVLGYFLDRAYIEDGRLHMISDTPLEVRNHPDYDFGGMLGFELCDE